ncbi:hypothetical protein SAMN04487976_1352 [Xaviernesmea oryzae]|nr:hypothetical protein SAMN04487976_1352 [Xaviernesmea oryzae]
MPASARPVCSIGIAATVLAVLTFGSQVEAANLLERAVSAAEPCSALKADLGPVSVGIDKVKEVRIDEFLLSAEGNAGSARLMGMLACKTSDKAAARGDASATIRVEAAFDLRTCEIQKSEAHVLETGGTYGSVIAAFSGSIEAALKNGIRSEIAKLCH